MFATGDLADKGRLRFGAIDCWLVYSLSGGRSSVTDAVSNASRTMLFDICRQCWGPTPLKELGIPESALPQVVEHSQVEWSTKALPKWTAAAALAQPTV